MTAVDRHSYADSSVDRVVVSGRGTKEAVTKSEAEFVIDASDVPAGNLPLQFIE